MTRLLLQNSFFKKRVNTLLILSSLLFSFSTFGVSSLTQTVSTSLTNNLVGPGKVFTVTSNIKLNGTKDLTSFMPSVKVSGALSVTSCVFYNLKTNVSYNGVVLYDGINTNVTFSGVSSLVVGSTYRIITSLKSRLTDDIGNVYANGSACAVVSTLKGLFSGSAYQSTATKALSFNLADQSNLTFSEKSTSGIESTLMDSWSVSTVDYDNDNDDDLFFTDMTANQPNRLFQNNGKAVFTKVTTGAIVNDLAQSMSSSWADFDNDGDLDVVVANTSVVPCTFYVNNGNGTFTKNITAGFTKQNGYYHHVSWVDVDNDGILELYLGNYLPTRFNELWKRDASGNWVLWADNLLSQVVGSSTGSTWADYDKDGFQDLLILNNEGGKNKMYHNLGNGNFESVSNIITANGGRSVGSTWGDIDNDGDLDLFISNSGDVNNDLFINNGSALFSKVITGEIVTDGGHSHGASFADIDKDMDLDLYVANDQGNKFLYLNNGSGVFTKVIQDFTASNYGLSFGVSFSDLDADGDMDLITSSHTNQKAHVFLKNNNTNKYYKIRLIGTASNKSAVGTRIRLKANGVWQTRIVNSQNGFGGQNSYRQHFGVGTASKIDSVIVYWPSGNIQLLKNVNVNQNTVMTESSSSLITAKAFYDANNNCVLDAGEKLLEGVKFKFNNGAFIALSDESGIVNINLAKGNYTVSIDGLQYTKTCSSTTTFSITTVGGTKNIGLFALKPVCSGSDVDVKAYTVVMRRGFPSNYQINVVNKGVASNGNILLTAKIPSYITIDSSDLAWSSNTVIGGNTVITWDLGTLNYSDLSLIHLYYVVPISVELGIGVQSIFSMNGIGDECNVLNDVFTDLQTVVGSVDPNDILAYPTGDTENHFINRKQDITYRIRFQNVGNYEAEFVNVIDELPLGIDVSSISNITSSHRYELTTEENKLHFYFPNIDLPDSTTNLEGSNGFIQFTVSQNSDVENGDILENKASIQFDYNEFIITNTVFHTIIVNQNGINQGTLILFPNPANEYAFARINLDEDINPEIKLITVYDLLGNQVYNEECKANIMKLEVAHLPVGSYMVSATDILGRIYTGKLIVSRY